MNVETGSAIQGNPFKPGDVVQLKSGGPSMTVTMVVGIDTHCAWFSLSAVIREISSFASPAKEVFPFQSLELATKAN